MSWGKGGGAGQRDSRVFSLSSHLKNVCKLSASTLCVDQGAVLILQWRSFKDVARIEENSFSQLPNNPFTVKLCAR